MVKVAKSETLLVCGAHSDDFVIGAGGTIAKYSKQGAQVSSLVFSYGEMSHVWLKPDVVKKMRAKEAHAAGKTLGCESTIFDLHEGKFLEEAQEQKLSKTIAEKIKRIKPTKIFVHSSEDPHPDHRAVHKIILEAYAMLPKHLQVPIFVYSVWNPVEFKTKYPALLVDVSETFSLKVTAIKQFKSQKIHAFYPMALAWFRAIRDGWRNKCKFAEKFYMIENGVSAMKLASKAKLLLVADTYHPKIDGTLVFMQEFLKRCAQDFELHLLVPQFAEFPSGATKQFLPTSKYLKLSGYPSIKLSWKNIRSIKAAVKGKDLLFIQGPALLSFLSMYYGHKARKKMISYVHVITWDLVEKFIPKSIPQILRSAIHKLAKKVCLTLYNYCDLLLVPYNELAEQLQAQGVTARIEVARLGVDTERFRPAFNKINAKQRLQIDPQKTVIGYVGRVSKEKNVESLLDAFTRLPEQENLVLLIVGDGDPELMKRFKATHNCMVTGFVRDVEHKLQAMDIFVMPSLTETTSLATLEAMATGLPVVATRVGYLKHYLRKDYNTEFFAKENPSMLRVKLSKLLNDSEHAKRLGANARKTVIHGFSWESSIAQMRRILLKEL